MSGFDWEWRAEAQGSRVCSQYRFLGQCGSRVQTPFMGLSNKGITHLGSQSSRGGKRAPYFIASQAQRRETWSWLSSLASFPLWAPSLLKIPFLGFLSFCVSFCL